MATSSNFILLYSVFTAPVFLPVATTRAPGRIFCLRIPTKRVFVSISLSGWRVTPPASFDSFFVKLPSSSRPSIQMDKLPVLPSSYQVLENIFEVCVSVIVEASMLVPTQFVHWDLLLTAGRETKDNRWLLSFSPLQPIL